jgi:hypothetical protein
VVTSASVLIVVHKGYQITASEYSLAPPSPKPPVADLAKEKKCNFGDPQPSFDKLPCEPFWAPAYASQGTNNKHPGRHGRIAKTEERRSVLAVQDASASMVLQAAFSF